LASSTDFRIVPQARARKARFLLISPRIPAGPFFSISALKPRRREDKADPRLEFNDLCAVKLIPVVAPGLPRMPISEEIAPKQMRGYVQCVIRDTARHSARPNFYIIEGAQSWSTS
jgi:hypothetical protein